MIETSVTLFYIHFSMLKAHGFIARFLGTFLLVVSHFFSLSSASGEGFPPTYIYKISPGNTFFPFEFDDIDGRRWSFSALRGKPIVILTGHRSMKYDLEKWAIALKEEFGETGDVQLLWVVNLSRFPWVSRVEIPVEQWQNFQPPIPLILDWHSQVGRGLRVYYRTPNIIGIDSLGRLAFHEMGPLNESSYEEVSNQIKALLKK